jgi:hypothetical protein
LSLRASEESNSDVKAILVNDALGKPVDFADSHGGATVPKTFDCGIASGIGILE